MVPLAILLLAAYAAAPVAHAADAERIIVTNARLIGRTAPSEDVHVNLLIVGGKLVVVTKDELVIQPDDVAVDASAGFLLGQLVLGTRPRFVVFAIQDGVIVKNELPETPPSPPEATPKPRRWVAYTPPPIAVPIRYYDSRKWNKFSTKPISGLFTGALVLDRQFWLSQDGNNEAQVGDLSEFEGGKIRAFRFGVVGTLNFKRPWTYTVFATTHTFDKGFDTDTDDEFTWFDYRLDIPLTADLTLSVGKQKEPISLERQTPIMFLPWQERSAAADAAGAQPRSRSQRDRGRGLVYLGRRGVQQLDRLRRVLQRYLEPAREPRDVGAAGLEGREQPAPPRTRYAALGREAAGSRARHA
jgi:phosphate-selective porin OprO/OprP